MNMVPIFCRVPNKIFFGGFRTFISLHLCFTYCPLDLNSVLINVCFNAGMTKNPKFVEEVSSHFRKHDEIIVGCQLGKRSMMAATDLLAAGFTAVTDIAGGFAAWTQNGLPTDN
ncbi:hypothetical protein POTOM_021110 [Populus tomentosa]|uniref:Rhodanese domain-containing protein n=1 Tax=Populus tomentosa TaxID=118781 RepID=A0A8X7ZWX7_POPTO|nr:hypothetical protein POTOM_021110 [Populus tomentosa]